MEIGAAIFFTGYSMAPTDLAVALEERGFDSLWVAEHSHIPVTRRFSHPLGDAALTKEYFDVMDPFVTLSAAAAATKRLKLGTAVCLVIQRDTIQTAKLVASLDQVSKGRFLFGIGCGWNTDYRRRSLPPRRPARDPLRRRDTPGGAERRFGRPRGVHAALASDGRRRWTRPAIAVGDVGRRARGHRCIEAQPRSRRYPHDRPPAARQRRRDPVDPRPLGEDDPAGQELT
jgi:hypothetical protein